MALDGLRSVVRRTVDTLTATPAITPASPGVSGVSGDPFEPPPARASARAEGGESPRAGDDPTFPCPTCARPLGRGTGRCGGCGTRLILDVPASRATVIAGAGLAVGVLVGGLGMAVFLPRGVAAPAASTAPARAGATGAAIAVTVPSAVGAALRGTTALNGRLAAEAAPLARAVAAKRFPTADVVRILRRMGVDVRAGSGMVPALGGWPDAAGHQAALEAFYAELADEIERGLAASVNSGGSYKAAARVVLATLARVPGLDADARALADAAGMDMPVVPIPETLR